MVKNFMQYITENYILQKSETSGNILEVKKHLLVTLTDIEFLVPEIQKPSTLAWTVVQRASDTAGQLPLVLGQENNRYRDFHQEFDISGVGQVPK